MKTFSSKGIPRKLIICPAHAWHKLAEEERELDECKKLLCCWHCSRQGHCAKGGGCSEMNINDYPDSCDVYPLTWEGVKVAYALYRILISTNPKDTMDYVYFSEFLKNYLRDAKGKGGI